MSAEWRRPQFKLLFSATLLVGTFLRLHQLGLQSMWFDEAARLLEARASLSYLLSNARQDTLPPLYQLGMHFWQQIGGGDFWLRIPSLFAGLLLIAVVCALARTIYGDYQALLASLLVALFPYQVFHAQQANLYSFLALFSGLTTLSFWRALHSDGRRWWIAYAFSALLGFYTHYYEGLLLFALHLFLLLRVRQNRLPWRFIAAADLIILIGLLPLTRFVIIKVGEVAGGFWLTRPSLVAPLSTLYLFTVSYSLPAAFVPAAFLLTTLLVTLAPVEIWYAYRRSRKGASPDQFVIILTFFPILLLLLVAQFFPIYLERTLIIVTPAYTILLARGLALAHRRSPMPYVAGLLVVVMGVSLFHYYTDPKFRKPDYRQAAAYVVGQRQPGDLLVHTGNGSYIPFLLYIPAENHLLLEGDPAPHHPPRLYEVAGGRAISESNLLGRDRVWLIVALDHSVEYQQGVVSRFDKSYKLLEETSVRDIIIRLYDLSAN